MYRQRTESREALLHEALELSDISHINAEENFKNSHLIDFIAHNDEDAAMAILNRSDVSTFINRVDGEEHCRNSALLLAIKYGFYDLAIQLIEKGADVSHVDAEGANAFHYACYLRHDRLLDALTHSASFKQHKNKCLQQKMPTTIGSETYSLTPADLYILELQPVFFNKQTFNILFNMDENRLPEYKAELASRPAVTEQGMTLFARSKPSKAMLAFAKESHTFYFKNRLYISSTQDGSSTIAQFGDKTIPTDHKGEIAQKAACLRLKTKQFTEPVYYQKNYKLFNVLKELRALTEGYLKHLKSNQQDPIALEKLAMVVALRDILNQSDQSVSSRLQAFKTVLEHDNLTLAQHRYPQEQDKGWFAFIHEAMKYLATVIFHSSSFFSSHGERFIESAESQVFSIDLEDPAKSSGLDP